MLWEFIAGWQLKQPRLINPSYTPAASEHTKRPAVMLVSQKPLLETWRCPAANISVKSNLECCTACLQKFYEMCKLDYKDRPLIDKMVRVDDCKSSSDCYDGHVCARCYLLNVPSLEEEFRLFIRRFNV